MKTITKKITLMTSISFLAIILGLGSVSPVMAGGGPIDGDGDGFFFNDNDPNDADPCIPDAMNAACDADNDGTFADTDIDDLDPCVPNNSVESCDTDSDGTPDGLDCAPEDDTRFPGADETLGDGIDQNCDGADNPTTFVNSSGNFTKMIDVDCVDGLDIANDTASSCDLWINYTGTEAGIMVDTIPAHLNVTSVSAECDMEFSNANGKDKSGKKSRVTSATIVTCELEEGDEVHIETITRESPSTVKNTNKLDKFSPTSCGLFEVNGGILFYEGEGPITSESIPDDTMDPISVYTTPDDLDCDEILNDNDKCPFTEEDFDGILDEDGCPDTEVSFLYGWDSCSDVDALACPFGNIDEKLNLQNSYVSYSTPSNGLDVSFHFEGADTSRSYQVGIHYFPGDIANCLVTFGGISAIACLDDILRQSTTADIEAFEFGTLTTDVSGDGEFGLWLTGISADTYDVQFHVREAVGCNTVPNTCKVIFQAPGPYGTTESITIP
jgi:hypothetical protein